MATRLEAMNLLSGLAIRAGDLPAAEAVLQDCLAIERETGDLSAAAETQNNPGMVPSRSACSAASIEHRPDQA